MPLPQTTLDSQQPKDLASEIKKTTKEHFAEMPPPRPFPYWPPEATIEMKIRNEVMMEVDKWSNNDAEIAKRVAETLILLLSKQFDIKLAAL